MITTVLPLARAPALPLHKAGPFVAAAYIVFVAVILIYVVIMATRLTRNELELARLRAEVRENARRLEDPVHEDPAVPPTRWRRRAPRNRTWRRSHERAAQHRVLVSHRARRGA